MAELSAIGLAEIPSSPHGRQVLPRPLGITHASKRVFTAQIARSGDLRSALIQGALAGEINARLQIYISRRNFPCRVRQFAS